jgi:hypothetical protein
MFYRRLILLLGRQSGPPVRDGGSNRRNLGMGLGVSGVMYRYQLVDEEGADLGAFVSPRLAFQVARSY